MGFKGERGPAQSTIKSVGYEQDRRNLHEIFQVDLKIFKRFDGLDDIAGRLWLLFGPIILAGLSPDQIPAGLTVLEEAIKKRSIEIQHKSALQYDRSKIGFPWKSSKEVFKRHISKAWEYGRKGEPQQPRLEVWDTNQPWRAILKVKQSGVNESPGFANEWTFNSIKKLSVEITQPASDRLLVIVPQTEPGQALRRKVESLIKNENWVNKSVQYWLELLTKYGTELEVWIPDENPDMEVKTIGLKLVKTSLLELLTQVGYPIE